MSLTRKRVLVIGAGPSGIAAATRLYENGIHDLLVLEAENRIGGRINTINIDDERLEMGAQWIHGEIDNVVCKLASERDQFMRSSIDVWNNILFARSNGEIITREISEKLKAIADNVHGKVDIKELLKYESSGQFYTARLAEEFGKKENADIPEYLLEEYTEFCHQNSNNYEASDNWFDSAVTNFTEYRELEGCHYGMWKDGYETLFSALMEKSQEISNGEFLKQNIVTDVEVQKIYLNSEGALVECSDGRTYAADHVIITVSLGVLKEQYEELVGSLPLPEDTVRAIKVLQIGTVDKMFLKFPYKWWPDDMNSLSLLWTAADRECYVKQGLGWVTDVFSFNRVEFAPLVLCGWSAGESARHMEQLDEHEVQATLTRVLKQFFSSKFEIPDPVACIRSTWWSNKHFRGSYSFRGVEADKLGVFASQLGTPVTNQKGVPVVLFAGEATHRHFFSTVHGAVESGWREADRVISLTK